jgi:N-acetyl-anhydromuramyl-L-alanine amidase AmpD
MRKINLLVVHCSASDIKAHDNIETLRNWHVKERGWTDIGYHYVITKDGSIHKGRKDEVIGAHVKGYNSNAIGICLTGDKVFSEAQFLSLEILLAGLVRKHGLERKDVIAHHDLEKGKTCPNFDVHEFVAKRAYIA